VATGWIEGQPFYALYRILSEANAKFGRRNFKIENVVDLCENALAYEGTLVLGAVIEIIGFTYSQDKTLLIRNLQQLQKKLKYGLALPSAISLYEVGFADRVISTELSSILSITPLGRADLINAIRLRGLQFREVLDRYPSYYTEKLNDLLHQPTD
jgi:POLQ-like helicase